MKEIVWTTPEDDSMWHSWKRAILRPAGVRRSRRQRLARSASADALGSGCLRSVAGALLAVLLLGGCKESKREHCHRIRAIVTEEMKATSAFGAAAGSRAAYAPYAVALHKASAAAAAVPIEDAALRKAVDTYRDAAARLAASYDGIAALDGGSLENAGGYATVGIVYGTLIDSSRIAIANACPD
ncbi:hypothetical protein BH11MYX4_BH11MYX4_68920 [soil metagenome]